MRSAQACGNSAENLTQGTQIQVHEMPRPVQLPASGRNTCSLRALLGELCLYRLFRDACSRNLRGGWDANALTRLDMIEIAQLGVEFMNFLQKLRITFPKVVHAYPEQGLSRRHANGGPVSFRLLIRDRGCVRCSR